MQLKDFLHENFDFDSNIIDDYNALNKINISTKHKKYPYNILQIEVEPTYKEISLKHIKNNKLFEKRGGGSNEDILVFMY
jgi:hypothetical protein